MVAAWRSALIIPLASAPRRFWGTADERVGSRRYIVARVGRDDDPQPPAMANLAGPLGANHPTRLIHMPVGGRAAALEDGRVSGLDQFPDLLRTARQRSWPDRKLLHRERFDDPTKRHAVEVFVARRFNP